MKRKLICRVLGAVLTIFLGLAPCAAAASTGSSAQPFSKSQVFKEALWQDETVAGLLEVKVGKVNKQNVVRVSAKCYLRNGTKVAAAAVKVPVVQNGSSADLSNVPLKFQKSLPLISLSISAQAGSNGVSYSVYTENGASSYWVESQSGVSGTLNSGAVFEFEDYGFFDTVEHYGGLLERLPEGISVVQNGTAWSVGANDAMLKLRYAARTMTFKGTFKVFFPISCGGRIKIRKFIMKATGFLYDGVGYGVVTCKSVFPGASWAIAIK